MTIEGDAFPMGYFYIISKLNGMALDIDLSEGPAKVYIYIYKFNINRMIKCSSHIYYKFDRLVLSLLLLPRRKRNPREILNSGFIKMVC